MPTYNWKAIQLYHAQGHGFVECRRRFGFSHTAWIKAIERGELVRLPRQLSTRPVSLSDRRRIYIWADIQAYYDDGHTYRQCREKFGFAAQTWQKARLRGEIRIRESRMPLEAMLAGKRCRQHVKTRLMRAGILQNVCAECGITDWRGNPLSMHIDHINGSSDDHRLENLRMLCPNCHSQTPTYGGRNKRLKHARRRSENLV